MVTNPAKKEEGKQRRTGSVSKGAFQTTHDAVSRKKTGGGGLKEKKVKICLSAGL